MIINIHEERSITDIIDERTVITQNIEQLFRDIHETLKKLIKEKEQENDN